MKEEDLTRINNEKRIRGYNCCKTPPKHMDTKTKEIEE